MTGDVGVLVDVDSHDWRWIAANGSAATNTKCTTRPDWCHCLTTDVCPRPSLSPRMYALAHRRTRVFNFASSHIFTTYIIHMEFLRLLTSASVLLVIILPCLFSLRLLSNVHVHEGPQNLGLGTFRPLMMNQIPRTVGVRDLWREHV